MNTLINHHDKAEDILVRAREFLTPKSHWRRGTMVDAFGRRCLIGALRAPAHARNLRLANPTFITGLESTSDKEFQKAANYLASAIRRYGLDHEDETVGLSGLRHLARAYVATGIEFDYSVNTGMIMSFNDNVATHEMVLAVLDDAIHLARVLNGTIKPGTLSVTPKEALPPVEPEEENEEEFTLQKELVKV